MLGREYPHLRLSGPPQLRVRPLQLPVRRRDELLLRAPLMALLLPLRAVHAACAAAIATAAAIAQLGRRGVSRLAQASTARLCCSWLYSGLALQ